MVQINFGQREVSCKVVFYGPGMSGKTTNLEIIHKKAPKDAVGEMVSIATETDRTLYFDFLPLDLGNVAGMRTKFQLYTVPGQIYYNATRKLVLQGVDGVIFVADSNPDKMSENLESFQNLKDNLAEMGLTVDDVPVVLQYNKRDLPNALSVADMDAAMNPQKFPTFEACAREGKGVFATLKEISRLVIEKLNKEHAPAANRRRTAQSLTPQGAGTLPPPSGATPVQGQSALPAAPLPPPPPTSSTPPAAMPVTRPIPAPAPAAPRPAPAPAPRPAPAPAPRPPAPVVDDARNKHLQKAKPPALDARPAQPQPNLGATDPTLKRYQDARQSGGGAVKGLLIGILGLLGLAIVLVVLVLFVPAVRALLPLGVQKALAGGEAAPTEQAADVK